MQRRVFVKSGALALVTLGLSPSFLRRTAFGAEMLRGAATMGARGKTLICLFQRGAADALNVIVPHGEPAYYAARPTIAIARPGSGDRAAIDLDGRFGLHPSLAPFERLWKERMLAPVVAVGSPSATRSHFDAQDFMESGTPDLKSTRDGWLNRYLAAHGTCCETASAVDRPPSAATANRQTQSNVVPANGRRITADELSADGRRITADEPFRAVALTDTTPRILAGPAAAVAMSSLDNFAVVARGGDVSARLEALYRTGRADVVHAAGSETFEAMRQLRAANPLQYTPRNGAEYPRSQFGMRLRQVAQLIKADVGLEVAFADVGGWDTHVNQGGGSGQLANRLGEFAQSVAALVQDLGDRMDDVVILTMSEFGRTVRQNGTGGTDHGHAGSMFVIGGSLAGGGKVHGRWPGLEREQLYEGRDLALTTDFRDVFGEVLAGHLGAGNLGAVFPGHLVDERLGIV